MGFAGSGTNLYAYAGDDPIDFLDPMGLDRNPSPEACYGGFAQLDGSCIVPGQNNNNPQTCSELQQFLANAGSQLSSAGNEFTWGGIGLVTASGAGAFFAPELIPAEAGGGELGADMIVIGGGLSRLGAGLTGYAQSGFGGAALGVGEDLLNDLTGKLATAAFFPGISGPTKDATNALLGEIPGALQQEEELCGAN